MERARDRSRRTPNEIAPRARQKSIWKSPRHPLISCAKFIPQLLARDKSSYREQNRRRAKVNTNGPGVHRLGPRRVVVAAALAAFGASRQPSRPAVIGHSSLPVRPGRPAGASAATALLALSALFAAPMPASAQSDIWSATMTVGRINRGSSSASVGYRVVIGPLPAHGSITDRTFSIDGNDYTVTA